MLKNYKVINTLKEFRCLNLGQLKFYMQKHESYKQLAKTNDDLNKRLNARLKKK